MRPALQRLLSRPSSLDFLQCLLEQICPAAQPTHRNLRLPFKLGRSPGRRYTNAALGLQDPGEATTVDSRDNEARRSVFGRISRNENESRPKELSPQPTYSQEYTNIIPAEATSQHSTQAPSLNFSSVRNRNIYGPWAERTWTREQLEFESALDQPTDVPRLLDQAPFKDDLRLWTFLLDYKRRKDGFEAVALFWEAFRRRQVQMPRLTDFHGRLLATFMEVGSKNPLILSQIVNFAIQKWTVEDTRYPGSLSERKEKRGLGLYSRIIQHFLLHGCNRKALHWHGVLSPYVSLQQKAFGEICLNTANNAGDLDALEKLYHHWKHYNVYSKIVPALCRRKAYEAAVRWHFVCLESQDLPSSPEDVRLLLHFLAVNSRPDARLIVQSLVERGVPFASSLSTEPEENIKLSREMMNRMHGATFNINAKAYNDPLGARWFATNWVSLDVAINTIHALGMKEIGPLSLQAIALRDQDAISIANRIAQLKALGISIGNSVFSRAVDKFSRNREHEYLRGLLASDQHPDELEDAALQENLLLAYIEAKDWAQYRRTLEIQTLRSKYPTIEKKNITLRIHAARADTAAVMETLSEMNRDGIIVKTETIPAVLRSILSHRTSSRRPIAKRSAVASTRPELKLAIHVLKGIMASGSYVPTSSWREILRRLGIFGYFHELETLCLFLAESYAANPHLGFKAKFQVPVETGTSSQLEPLMNLFSAKFQQAIAEWGFIRGMKSLTPTAGPQPIPNVTSGITLLKQLHHRGIYIDIAAVKKAILNRLVTYYGPSLSRVSHNRVARAKLGIRSEAQARQSLHEMAEQIDEALGGKFLTVIDLPTMIESVGRRRMRRVHRKEQRRSSRDSKGYT